MKDAEKTNVLNELEDDVTEEVPKVSDSPEKTPRFSRKQKIIAGVAAAVVVCGLGLGIAWGAGASGSDDPDTTPVVTAAEAEEDQIAEGTVSVDFSLTGDGWEEGSSPFIAHVTGETADGAEVDFYHAVWPDGSTDTVALAQGSYEVTYVSAINTDGSIYRTADVVSDFEITYDDVTAALAAESDEAEATTAITEEPETSGEDEEETVVSEPVEADPDADTDADADATEDTEDAEEVDTTTDAVVTVPVEEEFEKVDADDVTQEDLEEILDDLDEAIQSGDDTLVGDNGTTVVDTATGNAQNNPNADEEAIEEKREDVTSTVEETTEKGSSASTGSSSGTSSSGGSSSGSSSTSGSSSGSSSSSSSGSGSSSSSGSASPHTHNWVAQTTQKWVVDQAAYDETVADGSYIQCSCGETFADNSSWSSHNQSIMLAGGDSHSYSVQTNYTTVHHDEVGHYETVTTGYKCSTCGATK